MSTHELITKIEALREWEQIKAEAEAEVEELRDEIKAVMGDQEELTAGKYKVRYPVVNTTRFDTTAFRKEHTDLYLQFTKTSTSRRFSIA